VKNRLFLFVIYILGLGFSLPAWAELWPDYSEVNNPTLRTTIQSMIAHQRQWNLFNLYTLNLDTPGYVEIGGYNSSKGGNIRIEQYFRWREGPPEETNKPLDFMVEAGNRGFFCVRLPTGKIGFTKDGRCKLDNRRRLVLIASGLPILSESDSDIILPEGNEIAVSASGLIFVDNGPVDKIKVTVFNSENDMTKKLMTVNGVIFYAPEALPDLDPQPSYQVRQGFMRKSNVLKALTGDILMARYANEAVAKAGRSSTKLMTTVVQMANP
jgi:flagellar basal body rod protein FlgG